MAENAGHVFDINMKSKNNNDVVEKIIQAVEQRCSSVLTANKLSKDNPAQQAQVQWITGIYDDIVKLIKTMQ